MAQARVAQYGSWKSPITADLIVSSTIRPGQVAVDGENVYWIESRPKEGGRNVVVRRTPDGRMVDVTPLSFNARTRAHEYGGGDFVVAAGTVYFANFADQRLYRQDGAAEPRAITPEGVLRYADAVVDERRGRLICVREDHSASDRQAVNTLVGVDLAGRTQPDVLVSGNDFYASPRLSADGARLAWLTWHHPNMPWDGTELWVGEVAGDGAIGSAVKVAGGPRESIFQPEWAPDGTLYFVSDRGGWWNLYRGRDGQASPVLEMAAEFAPPQWVFGMSAYAVRSAGEIVCAFCEQGAWRLASLDTAAGKLEPIETPYSDIRQVRATPRGVVFLGGTPTEPLAVVALDLTTKQWTVLRRSSEVAIDEGYLSVPRPIAFPTTDGDAAYAFFYPPRNRDFTAPPGEQPPLLVNSHGGPTSAASTALNLGIQYWTSRGIAVLDVNYRGSTGYGTAYRRRLDGKWGIYDVDDCASGARFLAERGEVDGNRLAISGGSAGGYTTLAALTFRDVFKAGASHYGIGDLEALARDTHKFESRYLDRLIGPYPQRRDLYRARSPIHFTSQLSCPAILFQGLDDKVVPPDQAELMAAALRAKGLPVAYVVFEGEGHGFRRAENIKRALDGELYFYSRIFGFPLADPVEPVEIENLP